MNKFLLPAALALAVTSAPALAADMVVKAKGPAPAPTPMWDIAIGGVVMSDYNFRGISQSNKGASGGAYFEPQLTTAFGTLYAGIGVLAINWPSSAAYGFTDPSAEVDLYGGWRHSWGPLSLDLGYIHYYYPKEQWNGATSDSDFGEFYAKVSYAVTPDFTIGGNVFYTDDLLNYSESFRTLGNPGSPDAIYASATAKWVLPGSVNGWGAFVSGELGHWWIDDKPYIANGFTDPSYTYYNAGFALTYKALTIDFRYHGNDMDSRDCSSFLIVANPHPSNSWCKETFIVSAKFDTSLNALK